MRHRSMELFTLSLIGMVACSTQEPTAPPKESHPLPVIKNSPSNWGLDRIDQHSLPLDHRYQYFKYSTVAYVYVLDGPITADPEFGSRLLSGSDFYTGSTTTCDSHGMNVAGIIGSTSYGVAKQSFIVPVKVSCGSNDVGASALTNALNWVLGDVTANNRRPALVNISAGFLIKDTIGAQYLSIETAIRQLLANNIPVIIASGDVDTNTSKRIVPARMGCTDPVIVVTPTTRSDGHHVPSNYGECVQLSAPGEGIISTSLTPGAPSNLGGSSQAAPHVTGAAALYLQAYPTATLAAVRAALTGGAGIVYMGFIPPGPPVLGAVTPTVDSAAVSWTNVNPEIPSVVQYRVHGTSTWTSSTLAANVASTTLAGLAASTTYDLRLRHDAPTTDNNLYSPIATFTTLAGPSGPPSALTVSAIGNTSATLNWTNGDASATTDVSDSAAGGTWVSAGSVAAGVSTKALSGLTFCTPYSIRLVHKKNGASSPTYQVNSAFITTTVPPAICAPRNFTNAACYVTTSAGKLYNNYVLTWNNTTGAGSTWEILHNTTNNTATGTIRESGPITIATDTIMNFRVLAGQPPEYVWIHHKVGTSTSPWVQLNTFPFTYTTRCDI